jgi:hypothetical protein
MADIHDVRKYPKLRTYRNFKLEFKIEDYLTIKINHTRIRFLSKFRLSSHDLRIETGRYERPKLEAEQWVCLICNSGEKEDEEHFLTHCTAYNNERLILLHSCNYSINNIYNMDKNRQFNEIMLSADPFVQKSLGNYHMYLF